MKKLDTPRLPHSGSLARTGRENCFEPHSFAMRARARVDNRAPLNNRWDGESSPITVRVEAVRSDLDSRWRSLLDTTGQPARNSFPRRRQYRVAHQSFRVWPHHHDCTASCVGRTPVRA
jgi:hypothetical protein